MIEVSIGLNDDGWHVTCEVTDAAGDAIKGWSYGSAFSSFETAMLVALEEMFKHDGEAMIKMTRGAARAASRQMSRAGT